MKYTSIYTKSLTIRFNVLTAHFECELQKKLVRENCLKKEKKL